MKSLTPRVSYLDAVKKILASPTELDALVDPKVEVGDDLVKPLGLLRLLYGVPFHYLVPDERMLPPESIRFFHLDPDWLACLLEGALSPGRSITRRVDSLGYVVEKILSREAEKRSADFAGKFRSSRLGLPSDEKPWEDVSGFLLRSEVVREWPNLGVNAYPRGATPADTTPAPLSLLRFERLAPDLLLALFGGTVHRVDLHEAPQGLHFGLDAGFVKTLKRDETSGELRAGRPLTGAAVPVPFRDQDRRVVDVRRLAEALRACLDSAQRRPARPPEPLSSTDFALQMIQGVGLVTFIVDAAGGR